MVLVVVLCDNVVYVVSLDKFVYVLYGDDGFVIWKFEIGVVVVVILVFFLE